MPEPSDEVALPVDVGVARDGHRESSCFEDKGATGEARAAPSGAARGRAARPSERQPAGAASTCSAPSPADAATAGSPAADAVDERVDHRDHEQRQERRAEQAADDDRAELGGDDRALVEARGERDQREDRRDRRHQDRPHAGPAALDERVVRGHALASQPFDEVEQHDRVGDHDPDQHQEPDQGADADRAAR